MDRSRHRPVIDMTPAGEFREPAPPRGTWLDRTLARVGAGAVLVAVIAGAFAVAALAVVFAALLLPVAILAGLVGVAALGWRARRARRDGRTFLLIVRR